MDDWDRSRERESGKSMLAVWLDDDDDDDDKDGFGIKSPMKVDMPLNRETIPNLICILPFSSFLRLNIDKCIWQESLVLLLWDIIGSDLSLKIKLWRLID